MDRGFVGGRRVSVSLLQKGLTSRTAMLCEYASTSSLLTNLDTPCPKNLQGAPLGLRFSIVKWRGRLVQCFPQSGTLGHEMILGGLWILVLKRLERHSEKIIFSISFRQRRKPQFGVVCL